ncbi:MAG: L,D-transpeptidase, partial [Methylocapsa sp.]|nr:L,D-transpeptidase [Methylocapsa sp.]
MRRRFRHVLAGILALLAAGVAGDAGAARRHETNRIEMVEDRPAGTPLMAIISLTNQRITVYDAEGWILRAPVSSGQRGYETPAG